MIAVTTVYTIFVVGYVLVWYGVNEEGAPKKEKYEFDSEDQPDEIDRFYKCDVPSSWALGCVIIQGLLLLWGVFLAFETKDIPSRWNESKLIGATVYNMFLTIVIVLTFMVITNERQLTAVFITLLLGLASWWIPTAFILFMIAPKIMAHLTGKIGEENDIGFTSSTQVTSENTSMGSANKAQ
jgi:hypothetical protein